MRGRLYEKVCDLATLSRAWAAVKASAGAPGIDDVSLTTFEAALHRNLQDLRRALLAETYVPEPGRVVAIPKSDGTKRRLAIPSVRDRVAQQAVRLVIEPLFESRFLQCSYGYRPGRGPLRAVERVESLLRDGGNWVAQADIDDFFDTIDHVRLMSLVQERVWEPPVLRLLELWLKSGTVWGSHVDERTAGVPQGGVISPLLSNIYLHPFDEAMTLLGFRLVRYADDFLFVEPNRESAAEAARQARSFLSGRLGLKVQAERLSAVPDGFVFLGFQFKDGLRTIAPGRLEDMKQKIAQAIGGTASLADSVRRLNFLLRHWFDYYGSCDSARQFRLLDGVVLRELLRRLGAQPGTDSRTVRAELADIEFLYYRSPTARQKTLELALSALPQTPPVATSLRTAPQPAEQVAQKCLRQHRRRIECSSCLLVDRPGSFVGKTGGRVVVRENRTVRREIPVFRLKMVLLGGLGVGVSSDVVRLCAGSGVPLVYTDERGRPLAYVVAAGQTAHPLGELQSAARQSVTGKELARAFITGKVRNQLALLHYWAKYRARRESGFTLGVAAAIAKVEAAVEEITRLAPDDSFGGRLFAAEGRAAAAYWSMVRELLSSDVIFERREKRGATDLFNSLLNYGYGVLYSELYRLIVQAGLNPNIGFVHQLRADRPGLLFDLVEEFRQPVVDRVAVALIRRGHRLSMDGVLLSSDTRRRLVAAIMAGLASFVRYRGGRVMLREVLVRQVDRLVAALRGGEPYGPYVMQW